MEAIHSINNDRSYAVGMRMGGVWAGVARPNTPPQSPQLRKS